MKCPRCQNENPPGSSFCLECGARLALACASCGAELPAGSKFCNKCGTPVATEAPTQPRFASPESYTPKHLAEKILTSKTALEGERKQVTVLFADLKGSMELLADRDPEEARKILDPVLERMMEAVHRYEGTVNQVMGDGIMALFGAPLAHEDHAVRACYAALRMQEAVRRYAEDARRAHGVNIQIRVGLNSGEVVVRAIGSDLHMDYTAVGQTTHLAARMEQLAGPGTALLTSATLTLCEDFVQVKSLGPMRVKGLTEVVEAYELTGATPVRSRFQVHAARGLTKFVGRTSEMAQLAETLDLTRGGRGQVLAVVGEPGVGKSRLFWEFAHSHRTEGWLVLEAASVSYGRATTYLPVIELLRGYFQIEPRDDGRKVREKVAGKLFSLDRALEPAMQPLLALLDAPIDDLEWSRLEPSQRRQRTLDSVKRLLLRESQVQPLVLIFEDLHWIDGETQAVLEGLIESLPTAHLLLLINYRPEYQHSWGGKTYYWQLRIDALSAVGAEELLATLLGTDSSLEKLKELLITRTEGNPFFLEESVRTLAEMKALAGKTGAYRLTRALESLQIPATAQAILAARIDRLDPEDKRLLQAASVVGKDVPFLLLEAIADVSDQELRRRLTRLQAAEFLYETRLFPELEYTFKHALTHEVAYGGLLQERRRELHTRIVGTIETLHADRLGEHVERLAQHAVRGEMWEKAVTYLPQAGAKAVGRGANEEAASCFERALSALGRLPESRASVEQAIDLRFDLRNALLPLADHAAIFDHLRAAESLAERLRDDRRLGRIACYLCLSFSATGEHDQAIAAGRRAVALSSASSVFDVEVVAQAYLGMAYHAVGDFRQALDFSQRALALLTGENRYARFGQVNPPAISSGVHVAWNLAEFGVFAEGSGVAEDTVRLAEVIDQPYSIAAALRGAGLLYRRRGDLHRAIPALERALALCRSADIQIFVPQIASILGTAYVLAGRTADALPLLDQMLERVARGRRVLNLALVLTELSEALLLVGRVDEASTLAGRLLEISRTHSGHGYQAHAHRLIADIPTRGDRCGVDEATAHYREALALTGELGMRPLIAHCHLGLGKLYRRTGQREQAQEHLTTATAMYREMGMTYWLEQLER
jgi:class 3 adenylate cyclase/tetratricopeptide (TPR) repeat protein